MTLKNFTVLLLLLFVSIIFTPIVSAQDYWQQKADYKIDVDFDVKSHQYKGVETLNYFNNSPDTLFKIYYHLYLNAFQPNSMMDVRSRTILDPDDRVGDRISKLTQDEIGYVNVLSLTQSNVSLKYEVSETILEVKLDEPIFPNTSAKFDMSFEAQVPIQIRRTGRNSLEGIDYSMSQWFPKIAQYDDEGWHTSPYVAREFYSPWGDYEVNITIDKHYVLAATGILQNPNDIGYGYETPGTKVKRKGSTLTWRFRAENVHDFVWAADRDYIQLTRQVPNGPLLRFFFVPIDETKYWYDLPEHTEKALTYIESHFGKYGWSQYSIIQGGDGGMEYPMATLIANKKISGVRSLGSLVGVMVHEFIHSWYQGMFATNESYYAWMDEGFTSYADTKTENFVFDRNPEFPLEGKYNAYYKWVSTGREEPLTTHADHFTTNYAYSIASYVKGAICLEQLGYIIGDSTRDKGLISYYNNWAFRHPDMNDFIRVMENVSDIELSWYFDYWIKSTHTIDYAIDSLSGDNNTNIVLRRIGNMPMPVDIVITFNNGNQQIYNIPLGMMRGEKKNETNLPYTVLKDWPWTHPTYTITLDYNINEIQNIEIDPSKRMADIDRSNNKVTLKKK